MKREQGLQVAVSLDELMCGKSEPVPGPVLRTKHNLYLPPRNWEVHRPDHMLPLAGPFLRSSPGSPVLPAWEATWKVFSKEHQE